MAVLLSKCRTERKHEPLFSYAIDSSRAQIGMGKKGEGGRGVGEIILSLWLIHFEAKVGWLMSGIGALTEWRTKDGGSQALARLREGEGKMVKPKCSV
jgi:hypothetical protein